MAERKYRPDLSTFESRRKFLERIAGNLNNELCEPGLSPGERAKLYSALNSSMKILADNEKDKILVDLDARLARIEGKKP